MQTALVRIVEYISYNNCYEMKLCIAIIFDFFINGI